MIQFDDVHKTYGSDSILEKATFILGKREKCALVGRNGSGKTTLFRLVLGVETPDLGKISIPKNYRLGYLQQHIRFSESTILQEACLGLEPEFSYKAKALLSGLGFQEKDFDRSPAEFSGGFFLRLHLVKLLLSEPDCLLLDEPTNYLDIVSIRWLTRFLQNWQGEMIVISHDREFLDAFSTHSMAIHRHGIKKVEGPVAKLYAQIVQEEEVYEKTVVALEKKRAHMQSFIDRFGAKNTKATQAQSRKKQLERMPELHALQQLADLNFHFPAAQTASKMLVRVNNLSFGYSDEMLIKELSFEIEPRSRLGLVGKNGKGKSTLLKLLHQELVPSSGSLQAISDLKVGYFGQSHIKRLHPESTIVEEIIRANPLLSVQEARSLAGKMQFARERADKKIGVLSGGEQSRVVLAQLLGVRSHLLLLDEPTNHLDVESMESFMEALEEFEGAVCIVSHSELVVERLCDSLIIFDGGGQSHFRGPYSQFLEKGGWQEEVKSDAVCQKNERRLRAEKVSLRAKALKPHTERVSQLEGQIMALEASVNEMNEKLIHAFSPILAKAVKDNQELIEKLFLELEEAYAMVERIKNST